MVRDLVSDHHERLDGRGYPRGLTEEELPLHTRILTVCDVYDALVSDRVYRARLDAGARLRAAPRRHRRAFDERCVAALAKSSASPTPPAWVADVGPARGAGRGPAAPALGVLRDRAAEPRPRRAGASPAPAVERVVGYLAGGRRSEAAARNAPGRCTAFRLRRRAVSPTTRPRRLHAD